MPTREKWIIPSPLKNQNLDNSRSMSNTPIRPGNDFANTTLGRGGLNTNSASKPMGRLT